jgi:hypothetical protein
MHEIGGTGPQPIPAGAGRIFLTQPEEPYREVVLDAAVFDWLWRIVEAKYRQFDGRYPEATEVAKRGVIAFREAAGTLNQKPPDAVPAKRHRRLVRTPNSG